MDSPQLLGASLVEFSPLEQTLTSPSKNLGHILKCLEGDNEEMKNIIYKGCRIIFECSKCYNLFRNLSNLLLHKNLYCQSASVDDKKAMKTNPTFINDENTDSVETLKVPFIKSPSEDNISYEKRSSKMEDNINKGQIEEKQFSRREQQLKQRKDCSIKELKCLKCNSTYTSLKTLYFHMITIHASHRWYYPCPFCGTAFAQVWGVTRHLISAHHRTKDQVDLLREDIRKSAFQKPHAKASDHRKRSGSSEKEESMEAKVLAITDIPNLRCMHCLRQFNTLSNLRRHAASHVGWTRYKCRYCQYRTYNRSDCQLHIQFSHSPALPLPANPLSPKNIT